MNRKEEDLGCTAIVFMIYKLIDKKNVASILLATFCFLNVYSQESDKLYHSKYSKLSFVFQPSFLKSNYVDMQIKAAV